MILEAITFKLALDFFKYLKKNRITATSIRLDFFNRTKHQFTTFNSVEEMQAYFDENYKQPDKCELGSIISIQVFEAASDLYDFTTTYKAFDLTAPSYNCVQGSSFDNQRNAQRDIFKNRQLTLINNTVADYAKFYSYLNYIYVTGIYSPCYAIPGWSENTWWLEQLRVAILDPNNNSKFPYVNSTITRRPNK